IRDGVLDGKHPAGTTVGGALQRAIELNPQDSKLPLQLAITYRRYRDLLDVKQRREVEEKRTSYEDRADQVMSDMIQRNGADGLAWLSQFDYRREIGQLTGDDDLKSAVRLSGDSLEVRTAAARYYMVQNDPQQRAEAVVHWKHIIEEIDPKVIEAWSGVIRFYAESDQLDESLVWINKGMDKDALGPDDFNMYYLSVLVYSRLRRFEEAERALGKLDDLIGRFNLSRDKAFLTRLKSERDIARVVYLFEAGEQQRDGAKLREATKLADTITKNLPTGNMEPLLNLVASTHMRRGEFEQAALIYDRMAQTESASQRWLLPAAQAGSQAGKPDLALKRVERVARDPRFNDKPEFWLETAEYQLRSQLRRDLKSRNWNEFNASLKKLDDFIAAKKFQGSWRVELLRINKEIYSLDPKSNATEFAERNAQFIQRLTLLEEKNLDEVELLERLLVMYERLGARERADQTLKKLTAIDPTGERVRVYESDLLSSRGEFKKAEELIQQRAERASNSEDKAALKLQLSELASRQGDIARAREVLRELVNEKLANARIYFQLGQMAANENDWKEVSECEKWLKREEGEASFRWQVLATRRLLSRFPEITAAENSELDRRLQSLMSLERESPVVYSLAGLAAQGRGKSDEALNLFRKAVDYGERNPNIFQRLVGLLGNNVAEAARYLDLLNEPAATAELSGLQIQVAQRMGQTERAIELARDEVRRRPNDHRSHLWLAQVIASDVGATKTTSEELRSEGEQAIRKARELARDNVAVWLASIAVTIRLRGTAEARKLMEEVDQFAGISPSRKSLLRAEGWSLIGERLDAEREYLNALKQETGKPELHFRVAEFYANYQIESAIDQLRLCLKLAPTYEPDKRLLADCLSRRGGAEQGKEARQLLEALATPGEKVADVRQRVRRLIRRFGTENLRKARELLTSLLSTEKGDPSDRLLLAQIYEYERNIPEARRQYEILAKDKAASLAYLGGFVEFLLRQKDYEEATRQLDKLEGDVLQSEGMLSLRVQVLAGKREFDEISAIVDAYLEHNLNEMMADEVQGAYHVRAGVIVGTVKQYRLAEKYLRRAYELSPKLYSGLVECLALQERKSEALDVCLEVAAKDDSAVPVLIASSALLIGKSTDADFARCEPIISKALSRYPEDLSLLFAVGNARFFQQRVPEAMELYDRALKLNPRNVATLNNMAAMLGEVPERQSEALALIDQAIDLAGAHPNLLDTKAMILVNNGRAGEAIRYLEEAIRGLRPDPRFRFHLAIAYREIRQLTKARELFAQARGEEAALGVLTSFERTAWGRLMKEFGGGAL
ncbi:MAG: tetratricopeptide repeat protein, partial [Planctomycetota bacterium]